MYVLIDTSTDVGEGYGKAKVNFKLQEYSLDIESSTSYTKNEFYAFLSNLDGKKPIVTFEDPADPGHANVRIDYSTKSIIILEKVIEDKHYAEIVVSVVNPKLHVPISKFSFYAQKGFVAGVAQELAEPGKTLEHGAQWEVK